MKADKEIMIDGDRFVATRLAPDYKGEYGCRCEECHLSLGWTAFGQYRHCDKVKCIDRHFDEGNRNVWIREGGLDGVADVHAGMTIDCACCGERFEDFDGNESFYGDADGRKIKYEASFDYEWKNLGDKWYCGDCWEYVEVDIDGEEFCDVFRTKDGRLFLEDDEEFSAEQYARARVKEE